MIIHPSVKTILALALTFFLSSCNGIYYEYKKATGWYHYSAQDYDFWDVGGVKVDIKLMGPSDEEARNPQVWIFPGKVRGKLLTGYDPDLSVPERHLYIDPQDFEINLNKDMVPFYIGATGNGMSIGARMVHNQSSIKSGRMKFISTVFDKFAIYTKGTRSTPGRWDWAAVPEAMDLEFVVWAPGFQPRSFVVPNVSPKDEIILEVHLLPLTNHSQVLKAHKELEKIVNEINDSIGPTLFLGAQIKAKLFNRPEYLLSLRGWIFDDTLPSYLRWNALEVVASFTKPEAEKFLDSEFISNSKNIIEQAGNIRIELTPSILDIGKPLSNQALSPNV